MTRDGILAMKAGSELDALVGKRVLGLAVESYDATSTGRSIAKKYFVRDDSGRPRAIPRCSTTWEGMRLVVEAMRAKGWYVTMNGPDGYDGHWFARFRSRTFVESANADTAPHAVALAAMLAVGGGDAD